MKILATSKPDSELSAWQNAGSHSSIEITTGRPTTRNTLSPSKAWILSMLKPKVDPHLGFYDLNEMLHSKQKPLQPSGDGDDQFQRLPMPTNTINEGKSGGGSNTLTTHMGPVDPPTVSSGQRPIPSPHEHDHSRNTIFTHNTRPTQQWPAPSRESRIINRPFAIQPQTNTQAQQNAIGVQESVQGSNSNAAIKFEADGRPSWPFVPENPVRSRERQVDKSSDEWNWFVTAAFMHLDN